MAIEKSNFTRFLDCAAIMVGELGCCSIKEDDLKNWFPFDFLGLLGLATGSEVSAQCIEFRDAHGGLVRRIHPGFKTPCYSKGHVAIDELHNNGIGRLLNSFQNSQVYSECSDESYFTAVLENLIRGGLNNLTSEDKLSCIFRGLDCLCEKYNFKTKDLRKDLNQDVKINVMKAIKTAARDLSTLEKEERRTNEEQAKIIQKILGKISQCPFYDNSYGRAVIDLMHKFDLKDAEIIEAFYETNPRWDNRKWINVLPYYRGKTMHSGYFEFGENEHFRKDIPRFHRHLRDILLRIVLKMINYEGTYRPNVKQKMTICRTDWVNSGTSASELGYT